YEGLVQQYIRSKAALAGIGLAAVPYDGPIIPKKFDSVPAFPSGYTRQGSAGNFPDVQTHRVRVRLGQEITSAFDPGPRPSQYQLGLRAISIPVAASPSARYVKAALHGNGTLLENWDYLSVAEI